MSFERDALRGRKQVLTREIERQRGLAQMIRRDLRLQELSGYGEVDTINTITLADNVKSLCDAVDSIKKIQAELDTIEDALNG